MVGDFVDRRGYVRNFAFRTIRPVITTGNKVIELNPIVRDAIINDTKVVQMKNVKVEKVKGLFGNIAEEFSFMTLQGMKS